VDWVDGRPGLQLYIVVNQYFIAYLCTPSWVDGWVDGTVHQSFWCDFSNTFSAIRVTTVHQSFWCTVGVNKKGGLG